MTLTFSFYPFTFKLLLLSRNLKINFDEDIGIAGNIYSFTIFKGIFYPTFAGIKDFITDVWTWR